MIAAMLLLLQTAPAAPPDETAVANEVVIIGEKLKKWGARIHFTKTGTQCVIKTTTGDPEIDRIGCDALEKCWRPMMPRYAETAKLPRVQRRAVEDPLNTELTNCVRETRSDMVAELAGRRAAPKADGK